MSIIRITAVIRIEMKVSIGITGRKGQCSNKIAGLVYNSEEK